jgi:hypothetical protein
MYILGNFFLRLPIHVVVPVDCHQRENSRGIWRQVLHFIAAISIVTNASGMMRWMPNPPNDGQIMIFLC